MARRLLITLLILTGVSGCGPTYSPDTYASNAAQQANKVEQGVIVGVRNVGVSAAGTVGTVTGAAAGGIAGSQAIGGPASAFTALGGALVGGIAGSTIEHATADTTAFEYIVRKPNGDLVSVTQKDKTPLALGQKVLVIGGNQARVVADYTVPAPAKAAESAKAVEAAKPDSAPSDAKPAGVVNRGGGRPGRGGHRRRRGVALGLVESEEPGATIGRTQFPGSLDAAVGSTEVRRILSLAEPPRVLVSGEEPHRQPDAGRRHLGQEWDGDLRDRVKWTGGRSDAGHGRWQGLRERDPTIGGDRRDGDLPELS